MPDRRYCLRLALLGPTLLLTDSLTGCGKKGSKTDSGAPILRIGMELSYPPFEMQDAAGQPDGVGVRMAEALAAHLGRPLQIVPMGFNGLIPALQTGNIDLVLSSLTANDERREQIDFSVCFECRWSSHFQGIKAMLDKGMIGTIHYGEVDYFHGIGPWYGQFRWNVTKKGGGSALLTAGCHALDALLLCMGGEVEEVMSYATKSKSAVFAPYEYDTSSVTILKFADGRVGKCAAVVDCLQPYYFHTHLVGSEGSILDKKFHVELPGFNKHAWGEMSLKLLDSGDVSDHPYQTQFEAFFAALAKKQDMPLTSLADAVRSHEVIFAADRSAELGRPVKITEVHG